MIKHILQLIFLGGILLWRYLTPDANLQVELVGILVAGLGVIAIDLINWLINNRSILGLLFDSYKPFVTPEIRLTIAYLFRIEINGSYLLVKSNRIPNTFQPVGGVYKYFAHKGQEELTELGALTDNHIPNDNISEYDLRLNLQNRRHLYKFLKWFFKGENREIDPWREFYEELIRTQILSPQVFPYIHYKLVGQVFEPIHKDKFFNVDTFKYADIYIPKFWNHQQEAAIRNLSNVASSDFIWATKQEITQGKTSKGQFIADHSAKIFCNQKLDL